MTKYVYQPPARFDSFIKSVEELAKKGYKVALEVPKGGSISEIAQSFNEYSLAVINYEIDIEKYRDYVEHAGYRSKYKKYYPNNLTEKTLEHYIGLDLLKLTKDDIFLDIASENSPLAEICKHLFGVQSFSQDIMYEDGIQGNRIGGDACEMPVPDGFATKAILTCSLEHFEGDADTRLFKEMHRVLKPGGVICIIPFYLHTEAFTMTDPTISGRNNVTFDDGITIYCAEGWGNRHGRHYSPKSFIERIANQVKGKFKFDIYYLTNSKELGQEVYARFAFTATRL
jgi:SAM-dependent methyltransferase